MNLTTRQIEYLKILVKAQLADMQHAGIPRNAESVAFVEALQEALES